MHQQNDEKSYFLVCGNQRSGSTFLALLLSSLPDVSFDFEFQWKPKFRTLTNVHKVIPSRYTSVKVMLDHAFPESDKSILGSKLLFSPRYYNPLELRDLIITVDQDIKIIHLYRNPFDVLKSGYRHQGHTLRDPDDATDIPVSNTKIYTENKRRDDPNKKRSSEKKTIDINDVIGTMLNIRQIERFCFIFKKTHKNYLYVDYKDIEKRWGDICDFIGSKATPEERQKCLDACIIKKNAPLELSELYTNADEIEDAMRALSAPTRQQCLGNFLRLYGLKSPFVLIKFIWSRLMRLLFATFLKTRIKLLLTRP